jgi:hypothetical protein
MGREIQEIFPPFENLFAGKAWTGPGDGGAIGQSTGRDMRLPGRNQKGFRKGRRGSAAPPPPGERPLSRGFAEHTAVPGACGRFGAFDSIEIFGKGRGARFPPPP